MAYTKQTWADLPSKTTPINATRLTHIEDGIFNAAQTADTAASTAGTAAANVGILSGKVTTLEGQMYDVLDNLDDKVDKVAGKGLSTNDYDDTDKNKVDTLGTASNKNSTSVVTDSSDLVESGAVKDIVGFGNKNLLEVKASSVSIRQVVFTINSDKTITANGTATGGNASFTINDDVDIKAGAYILSGGINSNKLLVLTAWNGGAYVKNIAQASDAPVEFTIDFDGYDTVQASLFVRSDVTANDTFYPMISKDGGAYEPYHASVELSKYNRSEVNLLGAKNLNGTRYETVNNLHGANFVWNEDKTITVSTTASGVDSSSATVGNVPSNNDIFTAPFDAQVILTGGYSDKIHLYPYCYTDNARPWKDSSKTVRQSANVGSGSDSFWIEKGKKYLIACRVLSGTIQTTPVTIKPLLRLATDPDDTYVPPAQTNRELTESKCDNSVIGTVEGANASKAWSVGEHFIKDGQFKEVTQAIASGGAINDSNTVDKPIADCLVKQEAFTITTNVGGLANLTNQNNRIILRIDSANSKICFPYRTSGGTNNIIVFNNDMTVAENTEVSGTYYYI